MRFCYRSSCVYICSTKLFEPNPDTSLQQSCTGSVASQSRLTLGFSVFHKTLTFVVQDPDVPFLLTNFPSVIGPLLSLLWARCMFTDSGREPDTERTHLEDILLGVRFYANTKLLAFDLSLLYYIVLCEPVLLSFSLVSQIPPLSTKN